ncbi:hypothetical protein NHQ30_006914 [Ciborinia camelliae]|nr:hypothetical protein NHQ30_006914 [Ciborinia camelliae]
MKVNLDAEFPGFPALLNILQERSLGLPSTISSSAQTGSSSSGRIWYPDSDPMPPTPYAIVARIKRKERIAKQERKALAAADGGKMIGRHEYILRKFLSRKHKKLALHEVVKTTLQKKKAAEEENRVQDVKGQDVIINHNRGALKKKRLIKSDLEVTRSIANAQKMLLERHEGNGFSLYTNRRDHATQRESNGALHFSARKDWKACIACQNYCSARGYIGPRDLKRLSGLDPEYPSNGEILRWRNEHLFDHTITSEDRWKEKSIKTYYDLINDSDSEYDITHDHPGHHEQCNDCWEWKSDFEGEDEDDNEDESEDEESDKAPTVSDFINALFG